MVFCSLVPEVINREGQCYHSSLLWIVTWIATVKKPHPCFLHFIAYQKYLWGDPVQENNSCLFFYTEVSGLESLCGQWPILLLGVIRTTKTYTVSVQGHTLKCTQLTAYTGTERFRFDTNSVSHLITRLWAEGQGIQRKVHREKGNRKIWTNINWVHKISASEILFLDVRLTLLSPC